MISMRIGKPEIGEGLGCFILAEAGVNHNGSLAQACALVDAAVEAGATAIIQPGGSVRDEESIKACDEHNVAMVFTGIRHFRH